MNSVDAEKIGIILLAAGLSSRMGEPKQLLKIGGQPLVRLMVKQSLAAIADKTIVVIGYRADEVKSAIKDLPTELIANNQPEKGMGSSIKCGVSFLKENNFSAGLIITCDQPFLTSSHLNKLIEAYRERGNSIIASHYSNSIGVPALFDKEIFEQLLSIDDQQGAKKIIDGGKNDVFEIEFPEGNIDLDTPEDYRSYLQLIDKKNNL